MLPSLNIKEKSIDSVLLLEPPDDWTDTVRVMKPGAHLLLFSNVKDHHSGTIAAEDAGLEIRDTLAYVFANSENDVGMQLITMARKPLQGTVAENVLKWGTGGINVDRCRIGVDISDPNHRVPCSGNSGANSIFGVGGHDGNLKPEGRWPANLLHCGSEKVKAMFPNTKGAKAGGFSQTPARSWKNTSIAGINRVGYDDDGNAARFFYAAPCLNDLLAYLLKLITPPDGTVLTNCNTDNFPKEYNYVTTPEH